MTREQWKERLPLIQAFVEGKEIETNSNGIWKLIANPDFSNRISCYYIQPEPKLHPWKPEEVPVGCLVRSKTPDSPHNKYVLFALNSNHVAFEKAGWESLESLLANYEHSLDHGKTWQPCGMVE